MIFGVVSSASILLPVFSGIYTFTSTEKYRALFFFFCFALLVEIVANVLALNHQANNLWIYNIYALIEGVFWILLIASWLSPKYYIVPRILAVIYGMAWVFSCIIKKTIFVYNDIAPVAEGIILIPLSGFFLLELSRNPSSPVLGLAEFWFITGVLFYFASTALIQATASYAFNGVSLMKTTWYMHSVFNIITNFIFAKAFLCNIQHKRKLSL